MTHALSKNRGVNGPECVEVSHIYLQEAPQKMSTPLLPSGKGSVPQPADVTHQNARALTCASPSRPTCTQQLLLVPTTYSLSPRW